MDQCSMIGTFASVSSSYYAVLLSFNVAVCDGAAYVIQKNLPSYKNCSGWALPALIGILSLFSTYCGLVLFSELQGISLTCMNQTMKCVDQSMKADLKLDGQHFWLYSQVLCLLIDLVLMSALTIKNRNLDKGKHE